MTAATKHKWGDPVAVIDNTPTGCQETHRICNACGLVKITVHAPDGHHWREWQTPKGKRVKAMPACIEGVA